MVVEVRGGVEVMEANQPRVEVNVLLLGAHSVGKSGTETPDSCFHSDALWFCGSGSNKMSPEESFTAQSSFMALEL